MSRGVQGGTWVEVLLHCLYNGENTAILMSIFNWRDGEIRKLLTIMGEKVMQSHLTKMGKDGDIYAKDAEELSLRGFCRDKKQGVSNIICWHFCTYK